MPEQAAKFLTQDVDQLLENPEFRAWASRPDAIVPDEAVNIRQARMVLRSLHNDEDVSLPTKAEKDADFVALMARTTEIVSPETPRPPVRRLWPKVAAMAAAILLLFTAGNFLLRSPATVTYATGNAERLAITLPDGTEVTLNANSTLQLPEEGWADSERTVSLDGEAFFDVAKDKSRPFLVSTDDAIVRVLGTRFNVHERRGSTRIFLEEGEVEVGWPGTQLPETRMLPGEVVILAERGVVPVHKPAKKPGRHMAWKNGHLEFDRQPLAEALNEIGDIYGIEISCANKALEKIEVSSAGIPADNLTLALQLMEKALDLRIEAHENSVYKVFAAE